MILFFCSLVAIGTIGFTLLVREQDIPPAPVENPELKHLETRRQVLYDNLKDLQFEYHQGKLSDEDYQSLKSGFLYDLAGVMDAIERQRGKATADSKAVAQPPAKKKDKVREAAAKTAQHACPSCGASNSPSNRFCGQCGTALVSSQ